jgi:hypothetical protein
MLKPHNNPISKSTFVNVHFTAEQVEAILIREAKARINGSSVLYYGEIEKYRVEYYAVNDKDGAFVMFLAEVEDANYKPPVETLSEKETE